MLAPLRRTLSSFNQPQAAQPFPWSTLPDALQDDIVSRLPPEALGRLACVNRQLRQQVTQLPLWAQLQSPDASGSAANYASYCKKRTRVAYEAYRYLNEQAEYRATECQSLGFLPAAMGAMALPPVCMMVAVHASFVMPAAVLGSLMIAPQVFLPQNMLPQVLAMAPPVEWQEFAILQSLLAGYGAILISTPLWAPLAWTLALPSATIGCTLARLMRRKPNLPLEEAAAFLQVGADETPGDLVGQ